MTTESANGSVKFPVICEDAETSEILNALLENNRLILIANKADLSELLINTDRPINGIHISFINPFIATLQDGLEHLHTFMVAAKALVVLNRQTARDGRTCQVTTHGDGFDEDNYYHDRVPFRCELASSLTELDALEQSQEQTGHKTARALRNEAAVAGVAWSREAPERQRVRAPRIALEEYPPSED